MKQQGAIRAKDEIIIADWYYRKNDLVYHYINTITRETEKAVYAYDEFGKFVWIPKSVLSYYDENGNVDNSRLAEKIAEKVAQNKDEKRIVREYREELELEARVGEWAYSKYYA